MPSDPVSANPRNVTFTVWVLDGRCFIDFLEVIFSVPCNNFQNLGPGAYFQTPRPQHALKGHSIIRHKMMDSDGPETIQAIVALVVVLTANADNTAVDVLLAIVVGYALGAI